MEGTTRPNIGFAVFGLRRILALCCALALAFVVAHPSAGQGGDPPLRLILRNTPDTSKLLASGEVDVADWQTIAYEDFEETFPKASWTRSGHCQMQGGQGIALDGSRHQEQS